MGVTQSSQRARRFERAAAPRTMQLTARDLALLRHIAWHRFLSSAQLIALDGGNASNVLARLRGLYDHGYLDRPLAQLNHLAITGPTPMVYGMAPRGAAMLREFGDPIDRVDWTEKNKRAGVIFIQHTLAVAEFLTSLELSCRKTHRTSPSQQLDINNAEIIRQPEILAAAPPRARTARYPLRWTVDKFIRGEQERLSVVPDALFGLRFDSGTATFDTFVIFELDRGTIPIERSTSDHRSIRRKLEIYYDGWRARRHIDQLGIQNVRVMFLTSSPPRVEHMLAAVDNITGGNGSGFFLFADRQSLAGRDPLEFQWTNGRGEKVRLTD